jgi:hypothetical protein
VLEAGEMKDEAQPRIVLCMAKDFFTFGVKHTEYNHKEVSLRF